MLVTIKLIVYYQVRQESYIFFFKEERKQMKMRAKVMSLCLTSFFLQKQKENI